MNEKINFVLDNTRSLKERENQLEQLHSAGKNDRDNKSTRIVGYDSYFKMYENMIKKVAGKCTEENYDGNLYLKENHFLNGSEHYCVRDEELPLHIYRKGNIIIISDAGLEKNLFNSNRIELVSDHNGNSRIYSFIEGLKKPIACFNNSIELPFQQSDSMRGESQDFVILSSDLDDEKSKVNLLDKAEKGATDDILYSIVLRSNNGELDERYKSFAKFYTKVQNILGISHELTIVTEIRNRLDSLSTPGLSATEAEKIKQEIVSIINSNGGIPGIPFTVRDDDLLNVLADLGIYVHPFNEDRGSLPATYTKAGGEEPEGPLFDELV